MFWCQLSLVFIDWTCWVAFAIMFLTLLLFGESMNFYSLRFERVCLCYVSWLVFSRYSSKKLISFTLVSRFPYLNNSKIYLLILMILAFIKDFSGYFWIFILYDSHIDPGPWGLNPVQVCWFFDFAPLRWPWTFVEAQQAFVVKLIEELSQLIKLMVELRVYIGNVCIGD